MVGSSGFVAMAVESRFSELISNCIIWREKNLVALRAKGLNFGKSRAVATWNWGTISAFA
jgi:hypothetical protein